MLVCVQYLDPERMRAPVESPDKCAFALSVQGGDGHYYALFPDATGSVTKLLIIHIKVPLGAESDIRRGHGERGQAGSRGARGLVMCGQEHILGR